ncbi:MAG: hypothetical protein AB9Q19_01540 [Candidatus Reddybacter sp.]
MNTEQNYIEAGSKMAQALQDIIGETCQAENCQTSAERCPVHALDLAALVDEWEALYRTSNDAWQKQIINTEADDSRFIKSLGLNHLTPQAG